MSLKIKKKEIKDYCMIEVIGNVTNEDVYKLSKSIDKVISKGPTNVAIDVSKTTFLDSSALGVLILSRKRLRDVDKKFCIVNPTPYIRDLLFSTNLDSIFDVVEKKEDL